MSPGRRNNGNGGVTEIKIYRLTVTIHTEYVNQVMQVVARGTEGVLKELVGEVDEPGWQQLPGMSNDVYQNAWVRQSPGMRTEYRIHA